MTNAEEIKLIKDFCNIIIAEMNDKIDDLGNGYKDNAFLLVKYSYVNEIVKKAYREFVGEQYGV